MGSFGESQGYAEAQAPDGESYKPRTPHPSKVERLTPMPDKSNPAAGEHRPKGVEGEYKSEEGTGDEEKSFEGESQFSRRLPNSKLFWIMMVVLLIPSAYFIVGSFIELDDILESINKEPTKHTYQVVVGSNDLHDVDMLEVRGKIALELDSMLHRWPPALGCDS